MYNEALGDVEELHIPPMADRETASWFVYVVRLDDRFTQTDRDAIIDHLRECGIACNNYFVPIHTQPFITEKLGVREGDFPLTEHLAALTIALPFFARITAEQIERIKTALIEAIAFQKSIR